MSEKVGMNREKNKLDTEWLGLRQVTQYANISDRTIRNWIHSRMDPLPAVRVAGKILVRRSELDKWLERHRVKPLAIVDLDGIVKDALQGVARGR
jgi:excisionase family DNA binding protein